MFELYNLNCINTDAEPVSDNEHTFMKNYADFATKMRPSLWHKSNCRVDASTGNTAINYMRLIERFELTEG